MTRQPIPLPDAWVEYLRAMIAVNNAEARVKDHKMFASELAPYIERLQVWRDAVRACRKREQECEGK